MSPRRRPQRRHVSGNPARRARQQEAPPPGILLMGHEPDQVMTVHLKRARPLVDAGFVFTTMRSEDRTVVQALITDHIAGQRLLEEDDGAIVARHGERVVGALVVGVVTFDEKKVAFVRTLVVEEAQRGQGLGQVLLGLLPQLMEDGLDLSVGNCAEEGAGLYQRAGFTVLQPGVPLPFPFGEGALMQLSNEDYPCWFYRHW